MINQKYLIDFENLQVGDEIYYLRKGNVRVLRKEQTCLITSAGIRCYPDGRITNEDINPSFYKSNPFEEVSEFPKMMNVWNNSPDFKFRRCVIMERNGRFVAIDSVTTLEDAALSNHFVTWTHAEDIPEEPEVPEVPKTVLNKADIARLAGCNIEDLEILD